MPALLVVGACLALAALSLLWPSTPTYDPWSWIAWGRGVAHLGLDIRHGPSWKPLPVLFTTPLSVFGASAPDLWLVVSRAAGLLALVLAFRLAWRLVGGGPAGIVGGVLAAAALALSLGWFRALGLGVSEPLLVASVLGAALLHLDGRYRLAFAAVWLSGLAGPEAWPFIALYGLWLMVVDHRAWALVTGLGALLVALWLVPAWWGSGDPLQAFTRARGHDKVSYASYPDPAGAAWHDAHTGLIVPALVGAGLGALAAAWRRAPGALLVLALGGVAWLGLVVAGVATGFAGNPRYLMGGFAALAAAGGAGWGLVLGALGRRGRGLAAAATLLLAGGVVAAAWAPASGLGHEARRMEAGADARSALPVALARAGGRRALLSCGKIHTGPLQIPLEAWYLHVPATRFTTRPRPVGWVVQVRGPQGSAPGRVPPRARLISAYGPWRIMEVRCPRPT